MVMAKLHIICGNCGELLQDQTVELEYDAGEKSYEVHIKCPNCSTIHFLETNFNKQKESYSQTKTE